MHFWSTCISGSWDGNKEVKTCQQDIELSEDLLDDSTTDVAWGSRHGVLLLNLSQTAVWGRSWATESYCGTNLTDTVFADANAMSKWKTIQPWGIEAGPD